MFTGIIQEKGKILKIQQKAEILNVNVQAATILKNRKIGDSIAINGICSTVTHVSDSQFSVQYMPETLKLTTASSFQADQSVNLEASIRAGDTFDGHFVQGHVDGLGKVLKITQKGESKEITIEIPQELAKFTAIKGSITINGVSLTISKLGTNQVTVSLIPHTLEVTNLDELKEDDNVNIEADMIAKHLKHLLDQRDEESTYEFLRERNFI